MEEYGTVPSASGTIERAVRLPCKHVVGSECISIWLTQTDGGIENNTCPLCRNVLFQFSPEELSRLRAEAEAEEDAEAEAEHARIHTVLSERCGSLSVQLDLDSVVTRLARCIANRFHDRVEIGELELGGRPLGDRPANMVAAASIYMASHLFGDARSLDLVSSCDGLGVEAVGRIYGLLYELRYDHINTELLARTGREWPEIEEILASIMA